MTVTLDPITGNQQRLALPGQESSARAKPNLSALTGLRFFAAFGVVIYHFARPALKGWPAPLLNLAASGYTAVSLFFLLSGFILSYSYLNAGQLRGTARAFYASRFARIYPAYLLAFLLAAPTNLLWSLRVNHLPIAALKLLTSALVVLTLQQAWTPWTAWCWNFPAWSVSVEAFFYLAFPWIGPRLARLRLRTCIKISVALWLISLCAPMALFLGKGVTGAPELGDHLQMIIEFNPLLRLPEFVIGILLGRAYSMGLTAKLGSKIPPYLSAGCIILVLAFCPSIPHPLLANGLLTPLFALLILGLTQEKGWLPQLLSRPILVMLGEVSYGIYILQIPVAYVLRMPPPHQSLRAFGIYVLALLAAAILSWRFVESPLRTRLRQWLTKDESLKKRSHMMCDVSWPKVTLSNKLMESK
jgi:peptidoglycan/LPS O-acetylase OafA/YrhL